MQAELAAYLNKLLGYGVSGFRVDAGKHIGQDDLDAIYARLNHTKDGYKPYWALEVFGGGPGILAPRRSPSPVTSSALTARQQIYNAFKSYPTEHVGSIATLEVFGTGSGLTSSSKTMSFVTNHDTDRNPGEYLGHKDGDRFILANEWLLASGLRSPQIFSSFDRRHRPATTPRPSNAAGSSPTPTAAAGMDLRPPRPGIVGMIGWHEYVGKRQAGQLLHR